MTHLTTSDDKFRDLATTMAIVRISSPDETHRASTGLAGRGAKRVRVRARSALRRFKRLLEEHDRGDRNSKLRRMDASSSSAVFAWTAPTTIW